MPSAIISCMCGRYRLSRRKQLVEDYFETAPWDDDWNPRFNVAPTQPVPVIRQNPKEPVRMISLMRCAGSGHKVEALPLEKPTEILEKYGAIK